MRVTLYRIRFFILLIALPYFSLWSDPKLTCKKSNDTSYELTITMPVPENDALYADYISFSIDRPDITLSAWKSSTEPVSKYDVSFKKMKQLFLHPFTLSLQAKLTDPSIESAHLHMNSLYRSQNKHTHHIFPLSFATSPSDLSPHTKSSFEQKQSNQTTTTAKKIDTSSPSFRQKILTLFTETESWTLRLLLALLLGFLLSLTPCIYPMIPITIGVLQSQGTSSIIRNIISACTYITGIALTFSLFGTTAALSGKMFGSCMLNPIVIISIVAVLIYLAGSMIGLYSMYVPTYLQNNRAHNTYSSLVSIFLFGAVSGTVASPCLSPGLVLLLSFVTTTGNGALGFALLFCFGIGLGIPLLIIGSFSGSLQLFPQPGNWMVEVKQFFGFVILASCLYFLAYILPLHLIIWLGMFLSIAIGIFYFRKANQSRSFIARTIKNSIGIFLIALSVYLSFEAYKQTDLYVHPPRQCDIWLYDYAQAIELAQKDSKKILINISAPYCSLCTSIARNIFSDPFVQDKLKKFVTLHITDIDANETTQRLQQKFSIVGAPTLLIYDHETDQELKRWGGELAEYTPEAFVATLP